LRHSTASRWNSELKKSAKSKFPKGASSQHVS
jgi:hypothetical protein